MMRYALWQGRTYNLNSLTSIDATTVYDDQARSVII